MPKLIERREASFHRRLARLCSHFLFPRAHAARPRSRTFASRAAAGPALWIALAFAAPGLAAPGGQSGTASPAAASRPSVPGHKIQYHLRHRRHARIATPVVIAAAPPPAPPVPIPPVRQPARPATVDFTQGKLRISAENSSLIGILNQVSRQTGIAVEGLSHDERIYGQYGPGSVAGTLTQLLDGAGYDFVIVGGESDQRPTRLILTPGASPGAAASPTAAVNSTSSGATPTAAAPAPDNSSDPTHPKTPQEIFDELRRIHPQPQ